MKILGVVYPKPIAGARADVGDAGKIPVFLSLHGMKRPLRIFRGTFFQNKIHMLSLWRPNTKTRFVSANQFRSNRVVAFCECRRVALGRLGHFGSFAFTV